MDNSVFESGLDTGAFLLKAQVKVPASEFASPVLQGVVEKLSRKYETLIGKVLEGVESGLKRARTAKAMRLVVLDGGASRSDDLLKAGKPTTGKGYAKVSKPGSKGGKFWIDQKGNVRYDERPDGPSPKHREATDEEVIEHVKSQVTPTLFVGHDAETMDAIMEAGHFDPAEAKQIEWFRKILKDEEVLGSLEGIHNLEDIDARSFNMASGSTGAKALREWLDAWWYPNIMNPENYPGGKEDAPDKEDAKEWFEDLLTKYNTATKSPAVQEAMKANFIRLQQTGENAEADIVALSKVSEKLGETLLSPPNIQDASLVGLALMKGMNLVFMPTSKKQLPREKNGKTDTSMLGQIHANSQTLRAWRNGQIDLERAGATEAQAMMFVVADHMERHRDGTDYDSNSFLNTDNSYLDDMGDFDGGSKFVKFMEAKNGRAMSAGEKKHYSQRMAELGRFLTQSLNDQHNGLAPGIEEIMGSNIAKLLDHPDAISAIKDRIVDNASDTAQIMAAQENTDWETPEGPLTEGRYGGAGKDIKKVPDNQKNYQTGKPFELFSWQKKAINWMVKAKRGILAHGTGLGKTSSAVAFVEHMKAKGELKRGIFFLPPALMAQWTKEIEDYAPGTVVLDLSRYPAKLRTQILKSDLAKQASYILVSKGTLTGTADEAGGKAEETADGSFIDALSDIDDSAVFTDEVHQGGFKTADSAAYKLTQKVLTGRKYAFGMTATPLPNAPEDLFHLTNLFAPGTVGKLSTWQGRLAQTTWNPEANGGVGGYEISNYNDLASLNSIVHPRVFVKKFNDKDVKPEIASMLPVAPKPVQDYVFMSEAPGSNGLSQQDYVHHGIPKMVEARLDEIEKEREENNEEPLKNREMLKRLLNLNLQRQATISPELIDPSYRAPAESPDHPTKIGHAVEHIINHFKKGGAGSDGKGISLFCNFKKAFPILKRELAKRGIDPSIIGEVHSAADYEKGDVQDAFNGTTSKDGKFESKVKILLVGIKSGGAGLNLQKGGNSVYFLDEPYTAADKEQAIGRVFRVGQKDPVQIMTVHAHNSYDQRMNKMIESKNAVAQALLSRNSADIDSALTGSSELLGVVPPKAPSAETMAKFAKMSHLVQVRAGAVDDIWDSLQGDESGSLQDNEVVVNPAAAKNLPPHLRHTHDMKAFVKTRREKMEVDNALQFAKQDRLVAAQLLKNGDKESAAKYTTRADRLEALAKQAGKKIDAPKGKATEPVKPGAPPSKGTKAINKVIDDIKTPPKLTSTTRILITPRKQNPYKDGSQKKVDSSRDFAVGVKDKDDHQSHNEMHHWYRLLREKKSNTMGEFIKDVLRPQYKGTGITPEQLNETAQQIFTHLAADGLIEHTAAKK